ncbi:MAG: tRNA (adenosine(37)-N6)-threonylcarbamoyltransferase complex dimerization subunit type 1 TsaB [Trueperaceae bacterium]
MTATAPRLGLDTATPFLSLALWWPDTGRVARAAWRLDRRLAGELAVRVDAFVVEHGIAAADLGGIGVGVGPGSYTGARVGVAWATAAARALGVPLVGGDTLAARAAACIHPGERGAVATEARRGEAWTETWRIAADGRPSGGEGRRRVATRDLPPAAAASLGSAPDAAVHARRVDAPDAAPPVVRYEPADVA